MGIWKKIKEIKRNLLHECGGGVFVEYVNSPDNTKTLEIRYCYGCGKFITRIW